MPDARGLLVDYGGVLTASVGRSFRDFEREHDLRKGTVLELLQRAYTADQDHNPISRFERGEMDLEDFEEELASQFVAAGHVMEAEGLVQRLFRGTVPDERMWRLVASARRAGVRTGLLSNSWGVEGYPRDRFDAHFDAIVISGEVGLRKPSPEIFRLAAERLDLEPTACAFVDDLEHNVVVARDLGMFGVLHRDPEATAEVLADFLGVELELG